MPRYLIQVENNQGEHLIAGMFNDFGNAKNFGLDTIDGNIFKICEEVPFLWNPGDHIRGEKKPGGHIDWVRVPG